MALKQLSRKYWRFKGVRSAFKEDGGRGLEKFGGTENLGSDVGGAKEQREAKETVKIGEYSDYRIA